MQFFEIKLPTILTNFQMGFRGTFYRENVSFLDIDKLRYWSIEIGTKQQSGLE